MMEYPFGPYVLATKYEDGDPNDEWVVGFSQPLSSDGRYMVVDRNGRPFRANGFRRAQMILPHEGAYLVDSKADIEASGISLWTWLSEIRGGEE